MHKRIVFTLIILMLASEKAFTQIVESTPPPLLSVWCDSHADACNGGSGLVLSSPSGGTAPYTYNWSNGTNTQNIYNLTSGSYNLTVYDAVGDSAVCNAYVSNQTTLAPFIVAVPYTIFPCASQCNGSIKFDNQYLLGTPPFTITTTSGTVWPPSPNNGVFDIINLCPNTSVNVTITDANGCTGNDFQGMIPPPPLNPLITITPACNSLANGAVTIDNIQANWNWKLTLFNSINQPVSWCQSNWGPCSLNNLLPGNYTIQVTYEFHGETLPDYYGCPQISAFTIPDLGPACGTVAGNVFIDQNSNCIKDVGEFGIPNSIIQFSPGPYYASTNSLGQYDTPLPWGIYNVTQTSFPGVTQICPASPVQITVSSSTPAINLDFANGSSIPFDLVASLSAGIARPGFDFSYGINSSNHSYDSSGVLTVIFNYDPLLSFVAANPAPMSTSPGQVVWQLNSINNFQSSLATVQLHVPANPALIGTILLADCSITGTTTEANLTNNSATFSRIITGSFDPNEKEVTPAGKFLPATNGLLNYTIQFQNTGNDTAFTVELIDTLSANLQVTSFVPGAASHPYTTEITGQGILHFHFNNINLPDSTTDEAHSHGFVSFTIKPKNNLPHNTNITNRSNIIFDFNPPINTNTTQSIVDLTLAINTTADTICQGQSVTLTMIPDLTNTWWRWRAGTCNSTLIGSGNSITITPTTTNTYFVRDSLGTIPVGSCYRKTIVVLAAPATPVITQNLDTLFSSAASGNQWYLNGNVIAGAITPALIPTQSGSYTVVVTNNNFCAVTSTPYIFITTNLIAPEQENGIIVEPNPATSAINIFIPKLQKGTTYLTVFDCVGNKMLERNKLTEALLQLNISELPAGVYFVNIKDNTTSVNKKIIKVD